ncbi:MAG: hypothetical protein IKK82_00495 [Kiritimatiellae bacterium]|nr:hypothetical protein [Kiritimatiellia bacterium]
MGIVEKLDELVQKSASFQKIMEDGVVEDHEVEEQAKRVETLLAELERTLSPVDFERAAEFMAELSVLQVILRYNQMGGR